MRNALVSLLPLLVSSALAANVKPLSPWILGEIVASNAACVEGINHARFESTAGDHLPVKWTLTNGVILSGQGTYDITYKPVEAGAVVLALTVDGTFFKQVAVPAFAAPAIIKQPRGASIAPGARLLLSVTASDDAQSFEWFEGPVGDTTKLVATLSTELTTPPLTRTTSYWVRVRNFCGATSSQSAVVTVAVAGKRRAAGH